jgi:carboxylate-amine ligase
MEIPRFEPNDWPTLGVEIELQLVDARTMALRSAFDALHARLPVGLQAQVKPELMQCYLEINSAKCRSVAEIEADLSRTIRAVESAADAAGLRLLWAATHPFSPWHEQEITRNERYLGLVELLQDSARRLVCFGLHVHVGVDSGDKAVMIADRILRHLPTLLALSANSPFWNGRNTGLHSQRSKVMADLPTAGLPPLMRNWSEYVWLLRHMIETRFITTIREVWWDVRPHPNFGTVEVRICDLPPDLPSVLGLTALVQCLVQGLSHEIDRGTYLHDCHPFLVRLNKWRACRHGLSAELVDPYTQESLPARHVVRKLVSNLMGVARELDCVPYLESVLDMAERPTGSERQLAIHAECGDLVELVRRLTDQPWQGAGQGSSVAAAGVGSG